MKGLDIRAQGNMIATTAILMIICNQRSYVAHTVNARGGLCYGYIRISQRRDPALICLNAGLYEVNPACGTENSFERLCVAFCEGPYNMLNPL